jgi:hypothetical protein
MAIQARCPCGQRFRIRPDLAGKRVRCPKCKGVFAVPFPENADHADTSSDPLFCDALDDPLGLGESGPFGEYRPSLPAVPKKQTQPFPVVDVAILGTTSLLIVILLAALASRSGAGDALGCLLAGLGLTIVPVFAICGHGWARACVGFLFIWLRAFSVASVVGGLSESPGWGAAVGGQKMQKDLNAAKKRPKRKTTPLPILRTLTVWTSTTLLFLLIPMGIGLLVRMVNNKPGVAAAQEEPEVFVDPHHGFFKVTPPAGSKITTSKQQRSRITNAKTTKTTFGLTGGGSITVEVDETSFRGGYSQAALDRLAKNLLDNLDIPTTIHEKKMTQVDNVDAGELAFSGGNFHEHLFTFEKDGLLHRITLNCQSDRYPQARPQLLAFVESYKGRTTVPDTVAADHSVSKIDEPAVSTAFRYVDSRNDFFEVTLPAGTLLEVEEDADVILPMTSPLGGRFVKGSRARFRLNEAEISIHVQEIAAERDNENGMRGSERSSSQQGAQDELAAKIDGVPSEQTISVETDRKAHSATFVKDNLKHSIQMSAPIEKFDNLRPTFREILESYHGTAQSKPEASSVLLFSASEMARRVVISPRCDCVTFQVIHRSGDGDSLIVWDIVSGRVLPPLTIVGTKMNGPIAFSSDGNSVSFSTQQALSRWDLGIEQPEIDIKLNWRQTQDAYSTRKNPPEVVLIAHSSCGHAIAAACHFDGIGGERSGTELIVKQTNGTDAEVCSLDLAAISEANGLKGRLLEYSRFSYQEKSLPLVFWTRDRGSHVKATEVDLSTGELRSAPLTYEAEGIVSVFQAGLDTLLIGVFDWENGANVSRVVQWNWRTGEDKTIVKGIEYPPCIMAVSCDHKLLALSSGSTDGIVELWDLDTGTLNRRLTGPSDPMATYTNKRPSHKALRFSDDNRTLVCAGANHWVEIWDVPTGKLRKTYRTYLTQSDAQPYGHQ